MSQKNSHSKYSENTVFRVGNIAYMKVVNSVVAKIREVATKEQRRHSQKFREADTEDLLDRNRWVSKIFQEIAAILKSL